MHTNVKAGLDMHIPQLWGNLSAEHCIMVKYL